jgi:tetratricopeptide (TPR) repeat protein
VSAALGAGSPRARLTALNESGNRALLEGRPLAAIAAYEQAVRALGAADDEAAPALYENLGLAYVALERALPALRAFLRACDGVPESRPQALRFIVTCLANARRFVDAQRYLSAYERAFGPHPDGWTAQRLAQVRASLAR